MTFSLKEMGNYYRNLARNMVLIITFVSITPMILVSALILFQFYDSFEEKVNAHLTTLVKKHKQNIDVFLGERLANIRFLARTFTFEELSNESFLQDRLQALQDEFGPVFVDLGVINARGLQVAYAGPFKLGMALYSTADWFQKAMKSNTFISDVFLGLRGLPHFIVAVRENWKGDPWIIRATIDFVAFNNLVEHIRIGETGFAFILNRSGEFQTKPSQELLGSREPYLTLLRADNGSNDNPPKIGRMRDVKGVDNIYVAAPLKDGEWLLVYQQKASDAFSAFHRAFAITILVVGLGLVGIVSTAFIVSKRLVGCIALADKEKHMMNEQVVETGKLASVGELAAGIAHEINNPVAIMVEEAGWIEDLLEEEDFKEGANLAEFKRALNQIRTQGRRCKEITHKLLSFARKTDERVQEFDINEAINEIVSLSAQRAKYNNVSIKLNLAGDLPRVRLSQAELQQVLLNMINNALDAMEKHGGFLEITSKVDGNDLVLEVADNGPGIPPAILGRIFRSLQPSRLEREPALGFPYVTA